MTGWSALQADAAAAVEDEPLDDELVDVELVDEDESFESFELDDPDVAEDSDDEPELSVPVEGVVLVFVPEPRLSFL